MCLAVLAAGVSADWPLIVVANRDEFHDRPTAVMQPWTDAPALLAGRDLQAGGTWLGVTTTGRVALLTNYRHPGQQKIDAPSRGQLVQAFLAASLSAPAFLQQIESTAQAYNGFNLVVDDGQLLYWASNQIQPFLAPITPGIHGLSNALLDTPWPKTQKSTAAIAALLANDKAPDAAALMAVLWDQSPVPDAALPQTGLDISRERLLARPFIVSPTYGTRCTTVLLRHRDGSQWVSEHSFDTAGETTQKQSWHSDQGQAWRRWDAR
jgi:uncharacterized protein with NRDE domain